MHKFTVAKNFVNPWGTPMDANLEVGADMADQKMSVEYSDTDLADEKIRTVVDQAVADGSIIPVIEAPAPVIVEYVVVKGPVSNPQAEVFQTGNVMQLPEGDVFAAEMVTAGLIELKSVYDARPKTVAAPATEAPTTPAVAGSTEPRKRYRGKIVLDEYDRTVGVQTFKHIRTEEGHEYDLTDVEYRTEVHVAYPSQA